MVMQVDGGGQQVSFGAGDITAPSTARVSYDTPAVQTYSPNTGYTPPVGRIYGTVATNPVQASPSYTPTYYQPGDTTGGGGGAAPSTPPVTPPPPPHHSYKEWLQGGDKFGQAISDQTYVNQKNALLGKLGDYERNISNQVGGQNLELNKPTDPNDLLGSYWAGKSVGGKLYNDTKDVNGDENFTSMGKLGGSMGKNFDTGLANFNNEQAHGLRANAEDFASRGMLGSGSGVWQTATQNLQNQYNNQLTNMNDSTVGQYNNLIAGLADQYNQARPALTGYLGDAANRLATTMNSGLPSSA